MKNVQHNIPVSSGEKCVEPTDVMRAQHHIFIKHQSHDTVVNGIRTKKYSLNNCIDCHIKPTADGSYPSVNSEEHFCSGCHIKAAAQVECFDCHASKPLNKVEISRDKNENLINFLVSLEEDDDVQNVYSNVKFVE